MPVTGRPAAVHNAAALSPAAQCLCGVTGRGNTHSGPRASRYNTSSYSDTVSSKLH